VKIEVYRMIGSRKKVVIAAVVIAAVVAAGLIGFFQLRNLATTGSVDAPDTIILRKTDLESKVTASGNFASLDPVSVGSTSLGGEVVEVFVDEGDKVYIGDALARLSTTAIERSIADTRNAISDMARGDRVQLETAQRLFNEADESYKATDRQTNDAVSGAQAALATAEKNLTNANAALKAARQALDDAVNADPPVEPEVITDLTKAKEAAAAARDAAIAARDMAEEAVSAAVVQRENSLRAANNAWHSAKANLDSLQGVDSTRQTRSQLESLNEELASASILSPITGIVTKVLTEAGQTAMGSMFMIEDAERLKISASVAEFDIIKIEEGMIAHVTSNATGSKIYDGIVDFVAPVASDLSGNFEVSVLLTSGVGQLKPGMTATVEIVIAAKRDIFAVPIDAVVTRPDGTTVVYAYEPGAPVLLSGGPVKLDGADGGPVTVGPGGGDVIGGGPVTVGPGGQTVGGPEGNQFSGVGVADAGAGNQREIVVETGMETDFYIEIISDELREGMLIVADPMGRNVKFSGSGPMMVSGPGGGQAVGGGPVRSEGTVTYVAAD